MGLVNPNEPFEILDSATCWSLIGRQDFGRLAVSVAGRPDIFPVNFIVDDGTIVFRSAEGSKLASMAINSAVAFEVDSYDAQTNVAWSVVVHGQARLVHNSPTEERLQSLPLFPWNTAPKNRLVQIDVHEISGRRFVAEGKRAD